MHRGGFLPQEGQQHSNYFQDGAQWPTIHQSSPAALGAGDALALTPSYLSLYVLSSRRIAGY
jgi:hypothetical protein